MAAEVLSANSEFTEDWAEDVLDFDFVLITTRNDPSDPVRYPVDKLVVGSSITLQGRISKTCSSFTVNLCIGDDIALHINPRFDQKYIARNSKINKVWGFEESQLLCQIPLKRGQDFTAQIFVTPLEYMVSVNGEHLFSFAHRLAFGDVQIVEISPEVTVVKFEITLQTVYPTLPAPLITLPFRKEKRCPILAKLKPMLVGDLIEIIARVHGLPHSFYFNLQAGQQYIPHPIIPFHLVVRYMSSWQIVQNSWSGGKWNDEIVEKLPKSLLPGETFRLVINCLSNGFSTTVGFQAIKHFPHRMPPATANTLLIEGDLTVLSINSSTIGSR